MVSRDNWIKQMETKGGRGTDITPLSKGSMESIKEILPYAATLMFPIILIGGLCELIKLVRKKKKKKIGMIQYIVLLFLRVILLNISRSATRRVAK